MTDNKQESVYEKHQEEMKRWVISMLEKAITDTTKPASAQTTCHMTREQE